MSRIDDRADLEALRRIRQAEETGATTLDLSSLSLLHALPRELAHLARIQTLNLSWCAQLSDLTPLAGLTSLQQLDLNGCAQLSDLTPLAGLTALQQLTLSECAQLSDLTPLAGLTALQHLVLCQCAQLGDLTPLAGLTALQGLGLPLCAQLSDLTPLTGLTALQRLNLYGCAQLSDLTPLANLTSLQQLYLSGCAQLSDLTPLAGLTSLQQLYLSECAQLSDLTPLARLTALQQLVLSECAQLSDLAPLARLTALQQLDLSECAQLSDLAPLANLTSLQQLRLSRCRSTLRFAPLEILLSTLREIYLWDCQFDDLPVEICGDKEYQNVLTAVRAHYEDLRAGQEPDVEIKIFFLGNGGAGKSQLCRRLRGLSYDPSVPTTHGIQISEMTLELQDVGIPIRLNLWDFGGQEVYHGCHALFLQARAIFLILWTPELENETSYQENGLSMRHRPLSYWLDYLRAFGGVHSPVLLIQSQCDTPAQRVQHPPAAGVDDFTAVQSVQFSAKTSRGLDSVKAALKEAVRDCVERRPPPPIGEGRMRVRNRLRELLFQDQSLPLQRRRYRLLERADFDRLCDEVGGISDKEALLDFLHHSGVVFYRAGLFGGRIVLDQNWALEAVYAVFDRKKTLPLLRSYGRFSRADLEALVWSSYAREEQEVFLGMMESCGICFRARELPDREWEYIAPELLPAWSEAQESLLAGRLLKSPATAEAEACYAFLHEGVLRNYFSRIGRQAGDAAIYWKNGCWFYEKTTDSRVLIEGRWRGAGIETGEGTIYFRAWGEGAQQLIEPLLTELKRLAIGQQPAITWHNSGRTFDSACSTRDVDETKRRDLSSLVIAESIQPSSGLPKIFVSYAWGDSSESGRQREQVVEGLCGKITADGWDVVRDKVAMRYGDLISTFMKTISRADLVVVVLSAKYLRSSNCMTELYGIYQRALGEKEEFLARIIPLTLDDARIGSWRDRIEIARHWQEEFEEMKKSLHCLGVQDFRLYKSMQDWHNQVSDILAYVNDVLNPHGFEEIVKDDFAALRQMLQGKRTRPIGSLSSLLPSAANCG